MISKAPLIIGASLIIMTILSIAIFPSLNASPLYIFGIAIIIILDIIIALSLYYFLRSVNKNLSLVMSSLRIIYSIIFTIALFNISDLTTFYSIWDNGLLIFGIHLLLLGILVYKSQYIPKWLGILVVIASFGYIIDSVANLFGINTMVGMFTFIGEVLFAIWLIVKGRKISVSDYY